MTTDSTLPGDPTTDDSTMGSVSVPQRFGGPPIREKRARAAKALPTDRIKFEKHLEILLAYASASGPSVRPVSNTEVAGIVQLTPQTVSLGNSFWIESGLLQKGDAGYVPAPEVIAYSRARDWNPDIAATKLALLLERTWFVQKLLPKLRFREVKEEEALSDLADESAAAIHHRAQLKMLLDYMTVAGIIKRENGMLRLDRVPPPQTGGQVQPNGAENPPPLQQQQPPAGPSPPPPTSSTSFSAPMVATQGVSLDFSIRVTMEELASWEPQRITAFFGGLAQVLAAKGRAEQ